MKKVYLVLAIIGAIVPYVFFAMHFQSHGFGLPDFLAQIFANNAASGFTADLLISSAVLWCLMAERKDAGKPWMIVAVNLGIGLSCALPLYLYMRQND